MKKVVILLVLVMSTMLNATNTLNDSLRFDEDLSAKREKIAFKADMMKVKMLQVQIKHSAGNLPESIKYLRELAPVISNIERKMKK